MGFERRIQFIIHIIIYNEIKQTHYHFVIIGNLYLCDNYEFY